MVDSARTQQAAPHVAVIDVIRGLAAISVALLHIREVNWIGLRAFAAAHGTELSLSSLFAYLSFPVVWGSIGVPIFFVISGYVIHLGSRDKVVGGEHARRFWLRRAVRIYPTFVAALLITLLCDYFARQHGTSEKFGDLGPVNFLDNVLALVGITGTPYGSNGALWSLAIEIQFYAIYPLALVAWRRLGPRNMLLFTLVLSAVGYAVFAASGIKFFLTYYFSWWLGAYIADRQREKATARRGQVLLAAVVLALGCGAFFTRNEIAPHMIWSLGFALLLDALLNRRSAPAEIGAAAERPGHGLIYRALGKCGDFSYSLYAVHLPIAVAINIFFFDSRKQDSILWVFPVLAATMVAAYAVYRLVEVPSIRALRRLSR